MSHQHTFQLDQFNCFKHLLDKKRQATKSYDKQQRKKLQNKAKQNFLLC